MVKSDSGKPLKSVKIYTDGACSGNPGPGGWCAILTFGKVEKELTGGEAQTTNNRMELIAVIEALNALKEPCRVQVFSDSQYVVDAFNKNWVYGWERSSWQKSDKKPVKNQDLWMMLLSQTRIHHVTFHHVPGHAGHSFNERCDSLAQEMARSFSEKAPPP
jgi:ribonuclease HI